MKQILAQVDIVSSGHEFLQQNHTKPLRFGGLHRLATPQNIIKRLESLHLKKCQFLLVLDTFTSFHIEIREFPCFLLTCGQANKVAHVEQHQEAMGQNLQLLVILSFWAWYSLMDSWIKISEVESQENQQWKNRDQQHQARIVRKLKRLKLVVSNIVVPVQSKKGKRRHIDKHETKSTIN